MYIDNKSVAKLVNSTLTPNGAVCPFTLISVPNFSLTFFNPKICC